MAKEKKTASLKITPKWNDKGECVIVIPPHIARPMFRDVDELRLVIDKHGVIKATEGNQ